MSTHHPSSKPLVVPMRPRSPSQVHRASTPLELLFDLVFVVAVAFAGQRLHHGMIENHLAHATVSYLTVFFAIWWAWMNFSWFASAYDVDDVPYRMLVLVQMMGSLIMAAGVPSAFEHSDFTVTTMGYTVIRIALIAQWYRAWRGDPLRRPVLQRYIVGLILMQSAWVALLFAPTAVKMPLFCIFTVCELLIPLFAERAGEMTPWHPEHIVERYGLFTIIVLGESILSAAVAVQTSVDAGNLTPELVGIAIGSMLIVFTMWWFYFDKSEHDITGSLWVALFWGYGHFFIFASAAAVGAGLAAAVDMAAGNAHASQIMINVGVAVPVVAFMLSLAVVHGYVHKRGAVFVAFLITLLIVIGMIWTQHAVLWIGLILTTFLLLKIVYLNRLSQRS